MKNAAKAVLKYEKENDISKEKPERRKPKKRRQFDEDVDATRRGRWHVIDALACVEDVRLAEMWSQGVFIDRRHGLAVVVLVLQS